MNCADLKLSIFPYLDGELEHGEHAAAEEHLASCERCRVQLAETRQLLLVLDRKSVV